MPLEPRNGALIFRKKRLTENVGPRRAASPWQSRNLFQPVRRGSSLLAKQYHRFNFQRAPCRNPRGHEPQQRHH